MENTLAQIEASWQQCLTLLENAIGQQQFITWIRPLQVKFHDDKLILFAPNQFVLDHVNDNLLGSIKTAMQRISELANLPILLIKGNKDEHAISHSNSDARKTQQNRPKSNLNPLLTFETFVQGTSNELAMAAAQQVVENPGAYNPLCLYGDVGLGKTHLTQAVGNSILKKNPDASVMYVHSERFVTDMVHALQRNTIDEFKRKYRTVQALLIDDVQFFAGKERSQQELFHTINTLLEEKQQIILTCDRYPKEVNGVEVRLKSRFGWGLSVGIEPPELETRVAILISKASQSHIELPQDVAFFIAQHVKSNVRELEGALKRVIANAHFTGSQITIAFAKEALKDLLAVHAKLVSIDNIQKTVAEYYNIKMNDMLSKSRRREIARPRQMAMSLAKELTQHSLPEIGRHFGGKDHTTVIHACRKMKELIQLNPSLAEDFRNLMRILSA